MVFQLVLVAYLVNSVLGSCNFNYGPAGTTECVSIRRYNNQYQWATCLSNAYIQQKSAHKHICSYRSAKYCYYQCMLEVHGKESGSVSSDCSCTPGQRTTLSPWAPQPTTLPPECLSPSGKDCDWYSNCLERKYPCEATSNAYAIKYAEKFCNLYENNKNWFTLKGQQWIDAVRKCLQVELTPLLRPWRSPSCPEIRKDAMISHTKCYVNPDKDAPSVCDLQWQEFIKIFYTIKSSFIQIDTAWGSLKGLWNVGGRCGLNWIKNWYSKIIKIIKMGFINMRHRQSGPSFDKSLSQEDRQSRFADKVVSAIAIALKWNGQVLDWFAYHDTTTSNLYVVLADKKGLDIVQTYTPAANLNDTVSGLASAIKDSTLPVQVNGDNIWLTSLNYCIDKSCDQTQSLAVSSKPPVFPSSAQAIVVNGLLVGTSLLVQLTLAFWWSTPQ